jgi:hypothetical protein
MGIPIPIFGALVIVAFAPPIGGSPLRGPDMVWFELMRRVTAIGEDGNYRLGGRGNLVLALLAETRVLMEELLSEAGLHNMSPAQIMIDGL